MPNDSGAAVAPRADAAQQARSRILVVDDSALSRCKLSLAISALGYEVAVASRGEDFSSQVAYSGAIAGVLWSMLLLDERLSALAWIALGLMLLGLWFVEPRESEQDRRFRLPISRSRTRTGRLQDP